MRRAHKLSYKFISVHAANGCKGRGRNAHLISHKFSALTHRRASARGDDSWRRMRLSTAFMSPRSSSLSPITLNLTLVLITLFMNNVRRKMLVQHEQKLTKLCWTERVGRILLSSSRCRIPKDAHLSASSLMEPSTDILDIHGMQEWNDHRGIRGREREERGSMSES